MRPRMDMKRDTDWRWPSWCAVGEGVRSDRRSCRREVEQRLVTGVVCEKEQWLTWRGQWATALSVSTWTFVSQDGGRMGADRKTVGDVPNLH